MNDEPANRRLWTAATSEDGSEASNGIVTLVSFDDEGSIEILGGAFVIYAHMDTAICVGAAHSFEPPIRRAAARSSKRELSHLPGTIDKSHKWFAADEVFVMVVSNGEPLVAKITSHNSLEGYDVVVFAVVEPSGRPVFNWRFALNLRVPSVGDQVATFVKETTIEQLSAGQAKIAQNVHIRRGHVTDVTWGFGQSLMGQSLIVSREMV